MHPTAYQNEPRARNEGQILLAERPVPTMKWGRSASDDASRERRGSQRPARQTSPDDWRRARRADLVVLGVGASLTFLGAVLAILS